MSRLANNKRRAYRSPLRARRAEETRDRVLAATVGVMARGITSVSIPDVAREATVSVPTIYRHFRTKDELLAAVYPYLLRRAGLDAMPAPRSIDELRDGVRAYFDRVESFDDLARAVMASPASQEARRLSIPKRREMFSQLAGSIEPAMADGDRDRIARLLLVLTGSSALRMWRDQLGSSVDEAADDVAWVVRAAIGAANVESGR